MQEYWIETRYFAASIGGLTSEQYANFYKLCQSKVQGLNLKRYEITLCDYTQEWSVHAENGNGFWKKVNVQPFDDCSHDCPTFVNIFPVAAINVSLEGFPPDFIKKRNRYNKNVSRYRPVLSNDTEEKDWNLMNDFLEIADAIRGTYYGERGLGAIRQPNDAAELRIAIYEGTLMANNANEVDRWHILSKAK